MYFFAGDYLFGVSKGNINPLKHQTHKMVRHTQIIRRQIANELLECI